MTKSINSATYGRFREILRARRLALGVSQTRLADMLGQPQQFVSRYELGERRLDVAEFLDVAVCLKLDPVAVVQELEAWREK